MGAPGPAIVVRVPKRAIALLALGIIPCGAPLLVASQESLAVQSVGQPACPVGSGSGGAVAVANADTRGGHGCVVIDDGSTVHTFTYTGAAETWTVPDGVTSLEVFLLGAGGGGGLSAPSASGGGGGYVSGTLTVSPGQQLDVIVGQGGIRMCAADVLPLDPVSNRHNYSFGGGGMGNGDPAFDCSFASGGGRSAIRIAGTSEDVVTAGGGGGGGYTDAGGAGGGLVGSSGGGCGGGGGTQAAGGATCTANEAGVDGIKYAGGWAGYSTTSAVQGSEAGGGGGGYYGGGAAGDNGGGGGGSSYLANLRNGVTFAGSGATAGIGAPSNITPPVISGTKAVGATVRATGSSWTPGGVSTFQWQVSTDGVTYTNVSAATAESFKIRASGYLRVVETRTTIIGSISVASVGVTVPKPPAPTTTTTSMPTTTTIMTTTSSASGVPVTPSSTSLAPSAEPTSSVDTATSAAMGATTSAAPGFEDQSGLGIDPPVEPFDLQDNQPQFLRLTFDLRAGEQASGQELISSAGGLKPGSNVRLEMRSDPLVLGEGPADASGSITFTSVIPASVAPGKHRLILSGITPSGEQVSATAAFVVDDTGSIVSAVQASESRSGVPSERAMARALRAGKPIYDPSANVGTTAALALAAVVVLAAVGTGSRSPSNVGQGSNAETSAESRAAGSGGAGERNRAPQATMSRERRDESAQGSIDSLNTAGMKSVDATGRAWGDRSWTWRFPGCAVLQTALAELVWRLGGKSALATRLLADGHWVRAAFGTLQMVPHVIGLGLGVVAGAQVSGVFAPSYAWVVAVIVFALVDAVAGALAWMGFTVVVVSRFGVTGWFDLRTVLGLGVLFMGIPLLANHTRPVRRVVSDRMARFDRFGDYVIAPLIVGYAASAAYTALNGLSGLALVATHEAQALRWAVGGAVVGRMLVEDVVMRAYPERLSATQLPAVPGPSRMATLSTVVLRAALFVLTSASFLGFGWPIWLVIGATSVVPIVGLFKERLPNLPFLDRWFPSGVLRTVVMIFVGMWYVTWVIGGNSSPEHKRQMMAVLLVPGVVLGLIDLVAREGGEWPNNMSKRVVGACLWAYVLLVLVGAVTP